MRILIAEDERITRATLTRQLQSWGHTVAAAEDGEQAWEMFNSGEFDIVLTDWEMPKLSGLELVERLRTSRADVRFVYIIMLTGRSEKADLVRGIEAGADDFVSKPFDREELRVRLLAGERIVRLERSLSEHNARMRNDLVAASRVQQAMLPRGNLSTPRAAAAWTYVPTDELAGDAVGLHMIADRYLVAYVIDVSGHGVPAALLSVTAMHALSLDALESALLGGGGGEAGPHPHPDRVVAELNRRFCASENGGLFLTMILCVLDTHTGVLHFARAGHPLPIILHADGSPIPVPDDGGLPLGLMSDADYPLVSMTLGAGDRVFLFSDGFLEQPRAGAGSADQYGETRLQDSLAALAPEPGENLVAHAVDDLEKWAGKRAFIDDVSLVAIDYTGDAPR